MNNNSNPNTKCINCQHLVLDEKTEEYFCQKFSPHNTTKDKTWVRWPEEQSCGTEDIGYGTGKFLSKKSYNKTKIIRNMIININIDIELNNEQIYLLRKFYIDKSTRQFWTQVTDTKIADSLVDKDILKKDNMMNYTLTILGHSIIDKIDRDKIIDSIINK